MAILLCRISLRLLGHLRCLKNDVMITMMMAGRSENTVELESSTSKVAELQIGESQHHRQHHHHSFLHNTITTFCHRDCHRHHHHIKKQPSDVVCGSVQPIWKYSDSQTQH